MPETNLSARKTIPLQVLQAMFSRRWLLLTVVIVAGILLMVRLGLWQLDRLEQRRALNASIVARTEMPPLELNAAGLSDVPAELRYRQALAAGTLDYERQFFLRLQKWQGPGHEAYFDDAGSHIVTPLLLAEGGPAILVNRGWVPEAQAGEVNLADYQGQTQVSVAGVLERSQRVPAFAPNPTGSPTDPRLTWTRLNIEAIQAQMPYPLLPLVLIEAPDGTSEGFPFPVAPVYDLSEGSHLNYAIQWFSFALILAAVYSAFIYQRLRKENL